MKKLHLIIFALTALLFLTTSAFNEHPASASVGNEAPDIILKNSEKTFSLAQHRGQYVLVSFWSSVDAESRRLCGLYDAYSRDKDNIDFVGINLDNEETLFGSIVALDGMDASRQYRISGSEARQLSNDYGLDGKLGTILVGPDGNIVVVNPRPEQLDRLS